MHLNITAKLVVLVLCAICLTGGLVGAYSVYRWGYNASNIIAIVSVTVFSIIISTVLTAILADRFSQSILSIAKAAAAIGKGNFDATIEVKKSDEFGLLTQSINQMAGKLKEDRGRLEEWSTELERKVDDRTKELTAQQEAMLNIMEDLENERKKLQAEIASRKEYERRIAMINESFIHLGADSGLNINHLVALCGGLMRSLYGYSGKRGIIDKEVERLGPGSIVINANKEGELKLIFEKYGLKNCSMKKIWG